MNSKNVSPAVAADERDGFEAWARDEWGGRPVPDNAWLGWQARAALAQRQQAGAVETACNCRWVGEHQVQQCTLHQAHVDAIHEWAERAKEAEKNTRRLDCLLNDFWFGGTTKERREAIKECLTEEEVIAFLDAEMAAGPKPPAKPTQSAQPQAVQPLTDAAKDVLAERQRQISVEGWTPEHDDEHRPGELALAAACYAAFSNPEGAYKRGFLPPIWPWAPKWWKPSSQRRNLEKAGALILAAIERLDRANGIGTTKGDK